jgi:hypothetical protein
MPEFEELRPRTPTPSGEWSGDGNGSPEAVRFLLRQVEDIITADPGTSNSVLNKAAFTVGGIVAAGQLDPDYAYETLLSAANDRQCGDPESVITASIEAGGARPMTIDPVDPIEDEWVPVVTMKALRRGKVPEPQPFPDDVLPGVLGDLVRQGSKAVSCPPDFIGAGVLPVLGHAIGGYVSLRITESWHESPCIWATLVGLPSVRKTPALDLVLAPARAAARQARAEADRFRDEHSEEDGWVEQDPPKLIVTDSTIEALFGIMERTPRGLVMASDELDGWVKGMNQYKGGGADRQHWLSIWSRQPIEVDRKTTKSHYIDKPFVNVIGGIQPDPLEELMTGKNDGLLPRLLMAQGEFVTPNLQRGVLTPGAVEGYDALWNDLRDEGMTDRVVDFTETGWESYQRWVNNDHYPSLQHLPPELAGAWGKMDGQAARIALILAMVMGTEVTKDVVERTVVLIRYFQSQAAGLLQGSGSGSHWEKIHAARTKAVARFLVDNPGSGRGDVMAMGPEWAMDGRLVDRILEDCKTLGVWRG